MSFFRRKNHPKESTEESGEKQLHEQNERAEENSFGPDKGHSPPAVPQPTQSAEKDEKQKLAEDQPKEAGIAGLLKKPGFGTGDQESASSLAEKRQKPDWFLRRYPPKQRKLFSRTSQWKIRDRDWRIRMEVRAEWQKEKIEEIEKFYNNKGSVTPARFSGTDINEALVAAKDSINKCLECCKSPSVPRGSRHGPQEYHLQERALSYSQKADSELTRAIPPQNLWEYLPGIKGVVDKYLPENDTGRKWLNDWMSSHYSKRLFRFAAPNRSVCNRIAMIHTIAYYVAGQKRARLRTLTKVLIRASIAMFLALGILMLLGAIQTPSSPNSHKNPQVALTSQATPERTDTTDTYLLQVRRNPSPLDIVVLGLIGVTAAALTGSLSLVPRNEIIDSSPRLTHISQLLIKVSTGGIIAVLGTLILQTFGVGINSLNSLIAVAIAFGSSEELFTNLLDKRIDRIRAEALPAR